MKKYGKKVLINIPDDLYFKIKALGVNLSDFTRKAMLQRMNSRAIVDRLKRGNKAS